MEVVLRRFYAYAVYLGLVMPASKLLTNGIRKNRIRDFCLSHFCPNEQTGHCESRGL